MKNVWNWVKKRRQIIEVIFILFVPQICLVIANKSWQAMLMFLICSLVVCILFFQDRINKLKFGKDGLEIDLQKAIKEAYATIDNIKDLTDPILNFNLQEMAAEDFVYSGTLSYERIRFFEQARNLSKKLDLENTEELQNSFSKAKSAVVMSFFWEIERAFKKASKDGTQIANLIINNNGEVNSVTTANMALFNQKVNEVPKEDREEVQALYDSLEKFLRETSDIDDNFH